MEIEILEKFSNAIQLNYELNKVLILLVEYNITVIYNNYLVLSYNFHTQILPSLIRDLLAMLALT